MRLRLNQVLARGAAPTVIMMMLVAGLAHPAEARTRRHRKVSGFRVALQPFLTARSVIHAVADPIVHRAPLVVASVATAPIRFATQSSRPVSEEEYYNAESNDQESEEAEDQPIYRGQRIRVAEAADESRAVRVAYVTSRPRSAAPPRAQEDDEDQEADELSLAEMADRELPRLESSGSKPMVNGSRAILRNGIAHAPSQAPQRVKNAIWAANTLRRKPYVWGGGHGSFYDRGYDCSGTVSFALRGAGALNAPLPSSDFMRYGERGRGRWITIYSRRGHTFAMIAGLRLDTTDFERGGNTGPRWHEDGRDTRGYVARHPVGM